MMPRMITRDEAAEDLREQAASCRKLARGASPPTGSHALNEVAEYFDADARGIDPRRARR